MAEDCNGFDILFAKNVPHILEKIFLSLDYQSFKRCQEVNNTWKQSLTSETIKNKAKTVFHEEISKELLNACKCASNHDCEGEPCKGDNADEVKRLLSTGLTDVNCVIINESEYEETPLKVAVIMGHKNVVRVLLDAGADPNKAYNEESTPVTPLHDAVVYGLQNRIDVVNMLLDWGADIDKKAGPYEETPLHAASHTYFGDPEMVELLLNRGAEVNTTNWHGWTPYDSADERDDRRGGERGHRHSETLSLLGKHGGLSRYDWPESPYYRPLSE